MPTSVNHFTITFPSATAQLPQDCEWCTVTSTDGSVDRVFRFHDYDAIFAVPRVVRHVVPRRSALPNTGDAVLRGNLASGLWWVLVWFSHEAAAAPSDATP